MVGKINTNIRIRKGAQWNGMENTGASNPVMNVTIIADTAAPEKATLALAFVMMMNYLAILLYPFIVDFFQWIFHTQSQEFPFIFNLLITVVTLFWAYRRRHTFLFNDQLK